jgi:YVTN family beta-propeller protein
MEQLEDRQLLTAAVIATIPVGSSPVGLAENPTISRTYVANTLAGTVSVIDDATNTVLTTINLGAGSHPGTIGVDASTNQVFVVQGNTAAADDTVAVIDGTPGTLTENTVVTTIPVSGRYLAGASSMAVNPTTHRVYIPSFDPGGQVVVIDGSSNTLLPPISVAANPVSAAYDSGHDRIYVGHGAFFGRSELTMIDAATHAVSNGPTVGLAQSDLGVNADTHTLYVHKGDPSRGSAYEVVVVDTTTNTVTTTIPGGASSYGGVGVDPATDRIYVADSTLDAVWIIDGATGSPTQNTVIATVAIGDQPRGLAVNAALGRVYVANAGANSVSVLADVNSETNRFRLAAPMLVDHGYTFTLTKLQDGRLLAVGGNPASGGITAAAEIYDPQTGAWSLTGSLNTPRDGHSATLLPDGRVLIAGGSNATGTVASAELFDPQAGTFLPAGAMAQSRSGHTAFLLDNGKVLVAAGSFPGAGDSFGRASAELFDPASGTWTPTGSLNVARMHQGGARLLDGRVLVAGGVDRGVTSQNFNSAEVYNPATGTWSLTTNPMITARRGGFSLTTLASGKVLVAGGWTDWTAITTANAELFDPATASWAATTPLPAALNSYSATRLADGKVLVAGGNEHPAALGPGTYVTTGYLFDPTTELWSPTANQLSEVRAGHRAAPLPDGSVLIAGGWNGSTTVPSAEIFGVPNSVPVAHAGGPYSVPEGGSVQLNASGTTDADLPRDVLTYAWDFDGDGQYDDAVGPAPWFSAAALDGPTTVSVGLRVTDAARTSNIASVAISVTNVTPQVTIEGAPASSPEGTAITLTSTVTDPGAADQAAGFTYAWSVTKDGAAYAVGNQASLTFTPNDNATYVASLIVTDQDGAASPEEVCVFEDGAEAGRFRLAAPTLVDHGYQFTLTALADGRLLAVGGNPASGGLTAVAEIYDPRTGMWSLTGSLNVARGDHSTTLLPDGRVLIAGGYGSGQTLTSGEVYDPQTGTFSLVGSMNQKRQGHSAFLLANGQVLVVAGAYLVPGVDAFGLASAELFDPATGTWTPTGSLNVARMNQAGALLVNGRPLVAGGQDRGVTFQNFNSAEVYDPASDTWSLTANPMLTARRGSFALTTLPSGQVLAAGGVTDWIGPPTANAELFDPATGVWTSTSPLPAAVSDHTATLLEDGKVLIAGGLRSGTYLDTGYLFDPATQLWTPTPNPLIRALGYHEAVRLPGGPVLLVGGWNGTTTVTSAEIFGAARSIDNVPPTVNAGDDATVRPGVTFTQTGSFTDPGADVWSATVDYGDGSGVQPLTLNADKTFTLSHVFPAGNYSATVTVTVTDDDGGSGVDAVVVQVDNISPTVTGVTPSFAASGTLAGGATSLEIMFSESMTGGATAGNFLLQSLGPDALLGTADDTTVAVTASYAGTTTTLQFSALPASVYRLTVRETITDVAGNPLDGDSNGAAGGDWVREFVVLPAGGPLLGPSAIYATGGAHPYSVTHADFNGDGKLDLAVANVGSSDVGVLWGDGEGGFSEATVFPSAARGRMPSRQLTSTAMASPTWR